MYDYMETLKRQRFTAVDRKRGGITAHKILAIGEKEVTIAVPAIISSDGSITVSMGDTSGLQVNDFADYQFSYTIYGGKVNSYQMMFCGKTPPQFIPADGVAYTY
mgnify:CR=1 FL=1